MKTKTFPRNMILAAIAMLLTFILTLGPTTLTRAAGTVSLTTLGTPYSENFDTLANSGTSSIVPNGWDFAESGTNANELYTAGTGSSNAGDTYSFGASGSTERAFGGLLSGSLVPTIGASFTNDTGSTINQLAIAYTGEQWRLGTADRGPDRLDFQLSTDATSLTTGTWTDYDSLDFSSPVTTGTVGLRDGNAAANRTPISFTITGLNIAPGSTFWIRWLDFNASGADDGLAVDDFSLTPDFVTTPTDPSGIGAADPSNVAPGGSTLLTVAVTPGANPTSTGLTVTADLTAIGGSAAQPFFDDETNGDVTAGDNTFSYQATVDSTTTAGAKSLPVTITDAQGRTASTSISLTVEEPVVPAGTVVVSQVYGGGGNAGATYTHDFIELYNRGSITVTVAGWSVQYASAAGSSWQVTSLSGAIAPGGYYLVQQAQGTGGTTPLPAPDASGSIPMAAGAGKVALVSNTTALSGACPSGVSIVDFVGYGSTANCFEGSGPTATLSNTTAALRADGGATDTNDNAADFEVGAPNPRNSGFDGGEEPEIGNCGESATFIHEVQGSGLTSPLVGTTVVIEGVVVGDFQNNAQPDNGDLNGFHVQEEDTDADGDPATSEGIFVFAPGAADVSVGNQVRVLGDVAEFGSSGSLVTELTNVTLLICADAVALPAPTVVTLPVTDISDFERYEGMLVTFPQELVISEFFNFDRFNEIVLTVDRQHQPTAVAEPGTAAAAIAQANALSRITLDDGRSAQNPDPAIHPNGNNFDLSNTFRGGDIVQNATGIMDDAFGLYRIHPTEDAEYEAQNPRPAAPEDVGGSLMVASFNVLNYFLTIDDGINDICGPLKNQECRGADDQEELDRQRVKIIAALAAIDADVFGLIEMENTTGVEPLQDIVDGLNDELGPGTYAYIDTGTIGGDAIKVGIIYKPATVTPVGDFAILDSLVDPRFDDTRSRPVLAQSFMENAGGGIVTVAVNHLKSKGSGCGAGDDDPQQGNCNGTRTAAAEALVDWLATDPTGSGDADFLIIGDLNAYDKEDPIDAILEGVDDVLDTGDDYTDLIFKYQGEFAYSFLFDGQLGYLDHALAIENLVSQVTGATIWHINADEPDILDYDTTFKQPAQQALFEPNAFRSSDHDPVIVGLDLNGPPNCSNAAPSLASLWPPDHRFVPITVQGVTDPDGDPITITIDSIYQDEAVNAPDSGNTAPDGRGVGTSTAEVRAERIGNATGDGRVYHISFTASDGQGHSCSGTVLVGVPKSINSVAVDGGALFDSTVIP